MEIRLTAVAEAVRYVRKLCWYPSEVLFDIHTRTIDNEIYILTNVVADKPGGSGWQEYNRTSVGY